jgi:hypothetical protein
MYLKDVHRLIASSVSEPCALMVRIFTLSPMSKVFRHRGVKPEPELELNCIDTNND